MININIHDIKHISDGSSLEAKRTLTGSTPHWSDQVYNIPATECPWPQTPDTTLQYNNIHDYTYSYNTYT